MHGTECRSRYVTFHDIDRPHRTPAVHISDNRVYRPQPWLKNQGCFITRTAVIM
jgi:hypothetical protein